MLLLTRLMGVASWMSAQWVGISMDRMAVLLCFKRLDNRLNAAFLSAVNCSGDRL